MSVSLDKGKWYAECLSREMCRCFTYFFLTKALQLSFFFNSFLSWLKGRSLSQTSHSWTPQWASAHSASGKRGILLIEKSTFWIIHLIDSSFPRWKLFRVSLTLSSRKSTRKLRRVPLTLSDEELNVYSLTWTFIFEHVCLQGTPCQDLCVVVCLHLQFMSGRV